MTDYSKVPWLKVHDYLLKVGSCTTIREFTMTACREAEKLVPYDTTACLHIVIDGKYFDICLGGSACTSEVTAAFNTYYRMKQPGTPGAGDKHSDQALGLLMSSPVVDWRKLQRLEYSTDFMLPNKMCKSVAHVFPTQQIALSVFRSRLSPDFNDTDVTVLDVLNQHLNTYWPFLIEKEHAKSAPPIEKSALDSVKQETLRLGLTQREVEIALLLFERLSMPEIADRLFISPRTVQKHAENIYAKLGVKRKKELGEHLRGLEGLRYLAFSGDNRGPF
ncbi:MAG: helix-turn-helix transcriptional regulator [Spirochaetia bacterium]|jgi:DNA-binding CsgD family transcriptional regulator